MTEKLDRIRAGSSPRVLDLFCGCGGLSLGFQRAGFEILGGVEKEKQACWAYTVNLHRAESEERRKLLGLSRDIGSIQPAELLGELGHSVSAVDVIIGGPPCQAYARVGRAKLREIHDHPEAFRRDARGQLYVQYLHYVRELRPLALLLENVPDILNYGGRNLASEIANHLQELGYRVNLGLLNAANYGVPQNRRRVYLIACLQELDWLPGFPAPTHRIECLPAGYREFEALVASLRRPGSPFCGPGLETDTHALTTLPQAVTVREAIDDLPRLTSHLTAPLVGGRRRFNQLLPYDGPPLSAFAQEMREGWSGFEGGETVRDHVTRQLPRDYPIFGRMEPGDDYPRAHAIAEAIFQEEVHRRQLAGEQIVEEEEEWRILRKKIVPPYDPRKFPNKWGKLSGEAPARTLLAHLAHDSYTHIHYDSEQARTITVREAARLQSFPDGFVFYEAMNPAFRMIGNAVPPRMSFQLARHLLAQLREVVRNQRQYALAS
jgi:DNA (cytosine-5)-methyltransferase 1